MSIINIKAFDWEASLAPEYGGNLFRLAWRGRELLRTPPSSAALRETPSVYGIPIQFPPGRIDGGKFDFEGNHYQLPINEPERGNHLHGLVLSAQWSLLAQSASRVRIGIRYGKESPEFSGFPFDFELILEYRFTPNEVIQTLEVRNCGKLPMPCGIGFHPIFIAPQRLRVDALNWRWEILQPRLLATGKKLPWDSFDPRNWFHYSELNFSRQFPATPGIHAAQLDYGDFELRYEVDPRFHNWYLWNDHPQSGFIAIEPNSNVSGGFNLPLPHCETGVFSINPGENIVLKSQLVIATNRPVAI